MFTMDVKQQYNVVKSVDSTPYGCLTFKQLPQKRKRPAAKPSYGPKTARRPVQSSTPSTPKPVQNSLNGFAKDSEDTSPKVSEVTKSKLAAFSAADSVSRRWAELQIRGGYCE